MRKGIVAFVGMIIALVLLVVAFMGPWYTMKGSNASGVEFAAIDYTVGLYLTHMEAKGTLNGQGISLSVSYADALNQNVGVNSKSFTVITTAMYLTLLAVLFAVVAVIGMALFVFNKGNPKAMKLLGGVCGILAFLFALVPALYFMSTGFAQSSSGFWFSETVLGMTLSGGPGYAWYLMIVASLVAVVSAVAVLVKKTTVPAQE